MRNSGFRPHSLLLAAATLLLGTASVWAQSSLIGTLRITSGLTGSSITRPTGSAIMNLEFSGPHGTPQDNVTGDFVPFTLMPTIAIAGTGPFNKFYTDVCTDNQLVTATTTKGGSFDRVSGNLDDLRMTITVTHNLTPGAGTSF